MISMLDPVARVNTDNIRDLLYACYRYAKAFSQDPNTHVGTIIIPNGAKGAVVPISVGFNSFPAGMEITDEVLADKYRYILHAEEIAILNAARRGKKLCGSIMIGTWAPCVRCARAISHAGIAKLIAHKQACDRTHDKWIPEVEMGARILQECGVEYAQVDLQIGDVTNLMNGVVWEP